MIAALNALISEEMTGDGRRTASTMQILLHSDGPSLGLLAGGALIGWVGVGPVLAAGLAQMLAATGGALWSCEGPRGA